MDIECKGNLTLSSGDHPYLLILEADTLFATNTFTKRIYAQNPETKSLLNFEIATLNGTCCWMAYERRNRSRSMKISFVDDIFMEAPDDIHWQSMEFQLGWPIRKVKLIGNCNP